MVAVAAEGSKDGGGAAAAAAAAATSSLAAAVRSAALRALAQLLASSSDDGDATRALGLFAKAALAASGPGGAGTDVVTWQRLGTLVRDARKRVLFLFSFSSFSPILDAFSLHASLFFQPPPKKKTRTTPGRRAPHVAPVPPGPRGGPPRPPDAPTAARGALLALPAPRGLARRRGRGREAPRPRPRARGGEGGPPRLGRRGRRLPLLPFSGVGVWGGDEGVRPAGVPFEGSRRRSRWKARRTGGTEEGEKGLPPGRGPDLVVPPLLTRGSGLYSVRRVLFFFFLFLFIIIIIIIIIIFFFFLFSDAPDLARRGRDRRDGSERRSRRRGR